MLSEKEKKVTIHNSSVLVARSEDKVQSTVSRANRLNSIISGIPLDWLAYEELSRLYYSVQIRSVCLLSSVAIALFGGSCLSYDHSSLRLKSSNERKGNVLKIFFSLWLILPVSVFMSFYWYTYSTLYSNLLALSKFHVVDIGGFPSALIG